MNRVSMSEFGKVLKREMDGVWVIETPYTNEQNRVGHSDAHSLHRSSKVKVRARTFLSADAAERFLAKAYRKREKAGTLPVKTECTFKGQLAWLMPEVNGRRECYSLEGQWLSYLLSSGPDASDPNFSFATPHRTAQPGGHDNGRVADASNGRNGRKLCLGFRQRI